LRVAPERALTAKKRGRSKQSARIARLPVGDRFTERPIGEPFEADE
jgi:hypothetical protein